MIEWDGTEDLRVAADALDVDARALGQRLCAAADCFAGCLTPHREPSVERLDGGGSSGLGVFFQWIRGEVAGDDHAPNVSI